MYKPGKYLGKALIGEEVTTREALGAIGEGLVGIVAAFTGGAMLSPSPANAQSKAHASTPKRLTIDEYYQQARPADHIMPGAREQDFGYAAIKTHGFGFPGHEWADYYVNNLEGKGERMQDLFQALDGKEIRKGIWFDFSQFHDYWINNVGEYENVNIMDEYLTWSLPGAKKVIIAAMDKGLLKNIEKLW